MTLPIDTYIPVAPETNPISKGYLLLGGSDVLIYVSSTHELRSTVAGHTTYSTLALGVSWVFCVQQNTSGHVYYVDLSGRTFHLEYDQPGLAVHAPTLLNNVSAAVTVSALWSATSTPNSFMLMVDDGIRHHLYVATDAIFQNLVSNTVTFNNSLSTLALVSKPCIAMHPSDTDAITVTCERTDLNTDLTTVGFYEVKVPGVS